MAEGDGFHPFRKAGPPVERRLSEEAVGDQARQLLLGFIHDRLRNDGYGDGMDTDMMQNPNTPSGPPIHHVNEVAAALRRIGDELDGDVHLQNLVGKINPDSPHETFLSVARQICENGPLTWGRVVMLFYFAYKMILKAIIAIVNKIPIVRDIVEWVVTYIRESVAPWIISRGGWESVLEVYGSTVQQTMAVMCTGVIISALVILWKKYK